jgi:hypothetical protein
VAAVLPHRAGPAGAAPDHPGQAGPPRRPGTIEQLNAALVAKLAQGKLLRARKLRVDTTVVAADIDYPTDADLLEGAVRKLGGRVRRIKGRGAASKTQFRDRGRAAGRRMKQLARTLRRRTGVAMAEVDRLTGEVAQIARHTLKQVQVVVHWRLGARARKSVLVVHLASAGAWLGIDVVMAVLVFTALGSDDDRTKALSFRALELVAVGPLLAAGLVCLLSGVLLGLGSRYGLVRYWWVAVKLVLNLVLTGLVLVSLAPQVADAAARARQFDAGVPAPLGVGDLIFPPIVSPTALLLAMVLAVFKPWGRIRNPTTR